MSKVVGMDNPGLDVYLWDQKVGRLWLDDKRRFVFQYDTEWIHQKGSIPLSLHLPLREETYPDDAARPFFPNLLPEAEVKRAIAQRLRISESNDFALLNGIGGECAGAVSVMPEGMAPAMKPGYRELHGEELHRMIIELPEDRCLRNRRNATFAGRRAEQVACLHGRPPHLHRHGKCAQQPYHETADQGSGGYGWE
jgi:serine/threonine-protein kinase HipA